VIAETSICAAKIDTLRVERELARAFARAHPFPHIVIDDLFDEDVLKSVVTEMPAADTSWTEWESAHERKRVQSNTAVFGPTTRQLAADLTSPEFLDFLERLTGIDALIPDPHFDAAGYFDIGPGGYLDLHYDFARNERLNLDRRVNVLVYLNEGWQPGWGGELVLAESLEGPPVEEVVPVMNRTVVFLTPDAVHGHPVAVASPDGQHRLCFSSYYFTSPIRSDAPRMNHGVVFADGLLGSARRHARRWLPPVAIDALVAGRDRLRRGAERG